jgi:hypothetical protein
MFRTNYLFSALFLLLGGEYTALSVLMHAHTQHSDPRFVMISIAWALGAITTTAVLAEPPQSPAEAPPDDEEPPAAVRAIR